MGQLTHAISQVGKGVTKAHHLSSEEASAAMEVILSGRADPFELGAFLVAMRIKEETAEELTAFVRVAQQTLHPVPGPTPRLTVACYAGKRQTFPALIGGACLLAACGVSVGIHGHATPPERTSLAQVWHALGRNGDATPDGAAAQLKRAGLAYVGIESFHPKMWEMLELRANMGLRSCFHTMARLVNPYGADTQIVGVSHARTFDKFATASHALGYRRVVSFRGMEGEAEPNPLIATEGRVLQTDGTITDLTIDPSALGIAKASRTELMAESPATAAAMVRAVLNGEGPAIAQEAVALVCAVGLYATDAAPTLSDGMEQARATLASGAGLERLKAWREA